MVHVSLRPDMLFRSFFPHDKAPGGGVAGVIFRKKPIKTRISKIFYYFCNF